jgi:hypothetical protein
MPPMGEFVVIEEAGATDSQRAHILQAISDSGGDIALGLGPFALLVRGEQATVDAIEALSGNGVQVVITDPTSRVPPGLDDETTNLLEAWSHTLDPTFLQEKSDPLRDGDSWGPLAGCGRTDP